MELKNALFCVLHFHNQLLQIVFHCPEIFYRIEVFLFWRVYSNLHEIKSHILFFEITVAGVLKYCIHLSEMFFITL